MKKSIDYMQKFYAEYFDWTRCSITTAINI